MAQTLKEGPGLFDSFCMVNEIDFPIKLAIAMQHLVVCVNYSNTIGFN